MAERRGAIGYPVAVKGAFEVAGGGERTLWFLLTTRNPVDIEAETLAREEAAIDAEDIFGITSVSWTGSVYATATPSIVASS